MSRTSDFDPMNGNSVNRFTLLVLLQAQQDNATELVIFRKPEQETSIKYKVADAWYDLSQPPSDILPEVVTELERLAGLVDSAFPKEGIIDVPFSGMRLKWKIRMESSDSDCILSAAY